MKKKPISPVYCVCLYAEPAKTVFLHRLFQDKDEAISFGRVLWDSLLFQLHKDFIVTVSILENPKDFDHTYGQLVKAFFVPKEVD